MFYKLYRFVRKNILFAGLIILLLSIFINIPIWLNSYGKTYKILSKTPNFEYGLLLGTSRFSKSGEKNLFYKYRIDAAEKLLKTGKIKEIILSGSKDHSYDEAE